MSRSLLALLALTATASAYVPQASTFGASRVLSKPKTRQSVGNVVVMENFGFDFAEDQAANTPSVIFGEERLLQWLGSVKENNMANRQVR